MERIGFWQNKEAKLDKTSSKVQERYEQSGDYPKQDIDYLDKNVSGEDANRGNR